ncbi:MAG: dTMP kinase [Clostridia bacterium]|nr:dTMP kinase [Clostridia bacterium]
MPNNKRGFFVTLEGCEGSGKSTQIRLLENYMKELGCDCVFTREPGGTEISEKLREIILDGKNCEMTDETEALLYAAARVQLVKQKIIPYIEQGKIVICDRFIDSSFAYQAYARGLGYEAIAAINSFVVENRMPDLTVFYDISPDAAFARKGGADAGDRLEQSGIEFHRRVYKGYKELAQRFPDRIKCVDASLSPEEVFKSTLSLLKEMGVIG